MEAVVASVAASRRVRMCVWRISWCMVVMLDDDDDDDDETILLSVEAIAMITI